MKLDRKTFVSRVLLIILCFGIFMMCYIRMNDSYDPLARYPYATDENREIILNHMNDEDINYIINQQIKPDQFMSFIELDGFVVKNTVYYSICKTVQPEEDEFIINFVNKYRSKFTKDSLKEILKNYAYQELIAFYETESLVHEDLNLVSNPTKQYVVLNEKNSVYKYVPSDLSKISDIYLKNEVMDDLKDMMSAYSKVMDNKLTFESGYLSYENSMNVYVSNFELYGDNVKFFYNDAGMNEQQLGYSFTLTGSKQWIQACINQGVYNTFDYSSIKEEMDESELEKIEWLEENAYRYGFIIRYDEGKELITNRAANPYILRYVGKDVAKKMHSKKRALEEMEL